MSDHPRDLRDPFGMSGTSSTAGMPFDLLPASAAPASVCTDCGGRGWRRSQGSVACACLVRDVRQGAASHHALVDRLTVRLAEMDETIAGLKARVAELESSELLAWARREWEERRARD